MIKKSLDGAFFIPWDGVFQRGDWTFWKVEVFILSTIAAIIGGNGTPIVEIDVEEDMYSYE